MTPEQVQQWGDLVKAVVAFIGVCIAAGAGVGSFLKVMNTSSVSAKNSEQIDAHEKRINEMNLTLEAMGRANDSLRKEVDDLTADKNNLLEDQKQKTAQIDQLRAALLKADDRQRDADKTIARMQGQLDEQRTNYESMIDRQQRRLEELITANATEKQRTINLDKDLREAQAKHIEQTTIVAALEAELDRTKTELVQARSELTLTKSELAEVKEELAKIREQLAVTSRLQAESDIKRQALEKTVADLESKISKLMNQPQAPLPPGFKSDPPISAGI